MQLAKPRSIRTGLAAVTAALLGPGVSGATGEGQSETSVLIYSESQRVTAVEAVYDLNRHLKGPYSIGLTLTYDGLTGATPTGGAPSKIPQTITRPSGGTSTLVPAGQVPLDNTFKDNRFAIDAGITRQVGRLATLSFGGHASAERDYSSLGVNGGITRDFFRKNTTLGIAGSWFHDVTSPKGGAPIPFASVPTDTVSTGERREHHPGKPKNINDLVVSLSQVIDRKTIFRVNYSYDRATGYLNDPYKVLSVVQGLTEPDPGEPLFNVYENRPDNRTKRAVFGEVRRSLGRNSVDLSYRYFWDTWGIRSHTIDLYYNFHVGDSSSLEPHLRFYRQSRADFYHPFLVDSVPVPQFASADARLTKLNAFTIGLRYVFSIEAGSRLSLSAEYYSQRGDRSPPETFGTQSGYNLFPGLDAFLLRASIIHDL
jgi:hypothetical protein